MDQIDNPEFWVGGIYKGDDGDEYEEGYDDTEEGAIGEGEEPHFLHNYKHQIIIQENYPVAKLGGVFYLYDPEVNKRIRLEIADAEETA